MRRLVPSGRPCVRPRPPAPAPDRVRAGRDARGRLHRGLGSDRPDADRHGRGRPVRPRRVPTRRKLEQAKEHLKHLVFIVQENRSFDHYFGTFPGADGIPMRNGKPTVCVPDPIARHVRPAVPHRRTQLQEGGPHGQRHSMLDVDGGKMDGFIQTVIDSPLYCADHRDDPEVRRLPRAAGPAGRHELPHGQEIPNYWAYADEFVLQDQMFAPADSWTLPSHLFLVSALGRLLLRPATTRCPASRTSTSSEEARRCACGTRTSRSTRGRTSRTCSSRARRLVGLLRRRRHLLRSTRARASTAPRRRPSRSRTRSPVHDDPRDRSAWTTSRTTPSSSAQAAAAGRCRRSRG